MVQGSYQVNRLLSFYTLLCFVAQDAEHAGLQHAGLALPVHQKAAQYYYIAKLHCFLAVCRYSG